VRAPDRQLVAEILGRQRSRFLKETAGRLSTRPGRPAPRAETEVDDVIGDADHVFIVLDDEHGVSLIAQLAEESR
jgi:hypothetical protein